MEPNDTEQTTEAVKRSTLAMNLFRTQRVAGGERNAEVPVATSAFIQIRAFLYKARHRLFKLSTRTAASYPKATESQSASDIEHL